MATPAIVAPVRCWALWWARAWGVNDEDVCYALELVVSELLSNAVEHASGPATVSLFCLHGAQRLMVEVHDTSETMPTLTEADADAIAGRGLALVAQLSTQHGWGRTHGGGKTIWAVLDLSSRSLDTNPGTANSNVHEGEVSLSR